MRMDQLTSLLDNMTLSEKIGQLVQITPDFFETVGEITGPLEEWKIDQAQLYEIGSVLGTHTAEQVEKIQKNYLANNRLGIPLLFMADVIHGYKNIFPIPLSLAASFDTKLVEKVAHDSAKEASAAGIHVTFSPMADYVKDPRWGRVMESNGEDPILSSRMTSAYVQGYQGRNLALEIDRIASCTKHFIGYGAAEAGRDYNSVDLSDIEMYQNYLPPFQSAIEAGTKMIMTSFNSLKGVPLTVNRSLIQKILRENLAFDGIIISDWAAIAELINHRIAADKSEAAKLAFQAGIDIDMMSDCYLKNLFALVDSESIQKLDESVMRVLKLKNELGLFEKPTRGIKKLSVGEEQKLSKNTRVAAEKSMVLLKNDQMLPLSKEDEILLVGSKAISQDILGAWSWIGETVNIVSLNEALGDYTKNIVTIDEQEYGTDRKTVVKQAASAKKILFVVGESSEESGEAASKANLHLPKEQVACIQQLHEVNKNIILIVFAGRPLVLTDIEPFVKGIIYAWFPGSQGGNALVRLLYGDVNFSGRLPMSFPRSEGQLPLSYLQMSTGRPMNDFNQDQKYVSKYLDESNEPLFPFGYGLSYSEFKIKGWQLNSSNITSKETLSVEVEVLNNSEIAGIMTVQIYFQDIKTQIVRPLKELLDWQQIYLEGNETKTLHFDFSTDRFAYVHDDLQRKVDLGKFKLFVGLDSLTKDEKIVNIRNE